MHSFRPVSIRHFRTERGDVLAGVGMGTAIPLSRLFSFDVSVRSFVSAATESIQTARPPLSRVSRLRCSLLGKSVPSQTGEGCSAASLPLSAVQRPRARGCCPRRLEQFTWQKRSAGE
eukprot:scaffold8185_cov239-Pinguiococcus_pyrenoidosus.AAC.3